MTSRTHVLVVSVLVLLISGCAKDKKAFDEYRKDYGDDFMKLQALDPTVRDVHPGTPVEPGSEGARVVAVRAGARACLEASTYVHSLASVSTTSGAADHGATKAYAALSDFQTAADAFDTAFTSCKKELITHSGMTGRTAECVDLCATQWSQLARASSSLTAAAKQAGVDVPEISKVH